MSRTSGMSRAIACLLICRDGPFCLYCCSVQAPQAQSGETASSGGAPAAPGGQWKYAVVPPVVHPFYGPFPGAIADAEKDFNLGKVEYQLPQNFVQNEQNQILDGLVAKGYNAFAIQPADPVAGNAKIGELADAGMLRRQLWGVRRRLPRRHSARRPM